MVRAVRAAAALAVVAAVAVAVVNRPVAAVTPEPPTVTPPVIPPVSAVPEPATWAMMIIGFFGLGAAIRSNRARPSTSRAV